jgi:hypothetical protein
MGIVFVACISARIVALPEAAMTSTLRPTSWAASV